MTNKLISLIILIFSVLTGCKTSRSKQESFDSAVYVITDTVKKISADHEICLSGNIEGDKTVRLGFLVAGKINYIAANEGQTVLKGQLLSSLDPESYQIAKELADIQVSQVQDEYDRLKLMHDNNSLSESDFSKISHGLQQAKAQQKLHNKNLADTKLYSPINGILLKKLAEVGEIIGTGMPIFAVSDIRKVKVNAYIPENELHNIKIGQTAKVEITSADKTYDGKIIEVGSVADPASRAFSVKIEVDNPELLVRPGMIAEVRIESGQKKKILTIPAEAVLNDLNGQSFVYMVNDSTGKAFKRMVSLGQVINDGIEVISGLEESDHIVTGGQQKLVDGSAVIISKK